MKKLTFYTFKIRIAFCKLRERKYIILAQNVNEGENLGDADIDGRIILNRIELFSDYGLKLWIRFNWLRI
jgi:hypothetical protein